MSDRNDRHQLMGRICGGYDPGTGEFSTVAVCSCGHSFYGRSVSEADERFATHERQAMADV